MQTGEHPSAPSPRQEAQPSVVQLRRARQEKNTQLLQGTLALWQEHAQLRQVHGAGNSEPSQLQDLQPLEPAHLAPHLHAFFSFGKLPPQRLNVLAARVQNPVSPVPPAFAQAKLEKKSESQKRQEAEGWQRHHQQSRGEEEGGCGDSKNEEKQGAVNTVVGFRFFSCRSQSWAAFSTDDCPPMPVFHTNSLHSLHSHSHFTGTQKMHKL